MEAAMNVMNEVTAMLAKCSLRQCPPRTRTIMVRTGGRGLFLFRIKFPWMTFGEFDVIDKPLCLVYIHSRKWEDLADAVGTLRLFPYNGYMAFGAVCFGELGAHPTEDLFWSTTFDVHNTQEETEKYIWQVLRQGDWTLFPDFSLMLKIHNERVQYLHHRQRIRDDARR